MEHPPKQGLKLVREDIARALKDVLMEHPPKQGLKPVGNLEISWI